MLLKIKEVSGLKSAIVPVDKLGKDELQQLKEQFAVVFEEPGDLPPNRGKFDHKIPIAPGEGPVNIRPYRYPLKQRDVIEQLVQEM